MNLNSVDSESNHMLRRLTRKLYGTDTTEERSQATSIMHAKGIKFGTLVLCLEALFILLIALLAKYPDKDHGSVRYFPNFESVSVMEFIGVGFLLTFLKNYSYSAISFNL